MARNVGNRLDALKEHITRKDKPPWLKRVAEGLLEYAVPLGLGAGAKALSTYIVERREPGRSPAAKAKADGVKELLKSVFKDGAMAGVSFAKSKLAPSPENVSDAFVDAQKDAADHGLRAAQTEFIVKGSDEVTTRAQAESLMAVFVDDDKLNAVGDHQYEASRDAWVSYLAQARFGSKDAPDGKGQIADMSGQEERLKVQEQWLAGEATHLKPPAPSPGAGAVGRSPGILTVIAELPDIGDKLEGKPTVKAAMLNGVNEAIRDQYKGKPLAEMKIPRQVVARVNGWMPGFTINIDDAGAANFGSLSREEAVWLRERAVVGGMSRKINEDLLRDVGLRLLLQELVPADIVEKLVP
ncbi:MAG: hypothetical protein JNL83_17535 [Myxococcales bacterium]|nr:hypothetical protein [Myxococcales bacterium]